MSRAIGAQACRSRAGWTLLEIVIATVILLVVMVGFCYGLMGSTSLGRATREQELACEAARGHIEEMRATVFGEVLARYDPSPADDPATGLSPGSDFDVPGLTPRPGESHVGKIVFPLDDNGELREDLDLESLGMPRDLTGEGDIDSLDHSDDYALLPVLVRIEWRGAAGDEQFETATILKRMHP